jgi:hypothetical protein
VFSFGQLAIAFGVWALCEPYRLYRKTLGTLSRESPEEIEKHWIAEADRRFQELRDGVVQGIPAQEVFAVLRNKKS